MGHLDRPSPAGHQWQYLRGQPLQVIISSIAVVTIIVVIVIFIFIVVIVIVVIVIVLVMIVIFIFGVIFIIIIAPKSLQLVLAPAGGFWGQV